MTVVSMKLVDRIPCDVVDCTGFATNDISLQILDVEIPLDICEEHQERLRFIAFAIGPRPEPNVRGRITRFLERLRGTGHWT